MKVCFPQKRVGFGISYGLQFASLPLRLHLVKAVIGATAMSIHEGGSICLWISQREASHAWALDTKQR